MMMRLQHHSSFPSFIVDARRQAREHKLNAIRTLNMLSKLLVLFASLALCWGFTGPSFPRAQIRSISYSLASATTDTKASQEQNKAPPRTGFAQQILDFALTTPIWKYVLVPQARSTMVKTAEANGIPWQAAKQWLAENSQQRPILESEYTVPTYYKQAFHAYEDGNLSWDAALEVEIASCSVGARNFPEYGSIGEEAFRGAFESALNQAGAQVPVGASVLDMGCGTGMSTRRLAQNFPQAGSIQGIDLSPYFAEIGRQLLKLQPKGFQDGGPWVSTIVDDDRIEYLVGDAAKTNLEAGSFDVVNLQFVLHELPAEAALGIVDEALRLLKPSCGQLWICEMDFEAPAYAEQRANAMLFSLIRSTEPYLDAYAESISSLFDYIQTKFPNTSVIPATGRHYALVATKGSAANEGAGVFMDGRFNDDGSYRIEDTHLKVWESKQNQS
jgi:ubiquinone/menaquinone biosynthesis C-methylase UbiE